MLAIGAGGIGSPLVMYLVGAGFGEVAVIDSDVVEATNLHRQVAHSGAERIGMAKAQSAALTANGLNPNVKFTPIEKRLTNQNAEEIISQYDVVLDGSDNPATRYLVNDACVT